MGNKEMTFGSVITDISRGIQLTAEQLERCLTSEDTGYRYLALADIKNGFSFELNTEELRFFDPKKLGKSVEQFCIKPDMILLTKNDTPFKVDIAGKIGDRKIIVGGNIYMISVDAGKVIPRWLCYWLQSKEGMERLRGASSCTHNGKMKWISIKQIESVMIPSIDFQQQADELILKINEYTRWLAHLTEEFRRNSQEIFAIFNSLGITTSNEETEAEFEKKTSFFSDNN